MRPSDGITKSLRGIALLAAGGLLSACSAGEFYRAALFSSSGASLSLEQISEPVAGECVKLAELNVVDSDGAPVVLPDGVCVTLSYAGDAGDSETVPGLFGAAGCGDSGFPVSQEVCGDGTSAFAPISVYASYSDADKGSDVALSFSLSSDSMVIATSETVWDAAVRGHVRSVSLSKGGGLISGEPAGMTDTAPAGCAVMTNGTVQCWGSNAEGQTGQDVGTSEVASPAKVVPSVGGELTGVTEVSVGRAITCVISDDGVKLRCWGLGNMGILGAGLPPGTLWPATGFIEGLPSGAALSSISVGYGHACVLADGSAYCWGANFASQLGYSAGAGWSGTPGLLSGSGGASLSDFLGITAGDFHSCARTADALYCWGTDRRMIAGQDDYQDLLGLTSGDDGAKSIPGTVTLPSGATGDLSDLQAGLSATCALMGGKVYCWGRSDNEIFGNGTALAANKTVGTVSGATAVKTGALSFLSNVAQISVGATHACARLDSGDVYCWGENAMGQLGLGLGNTSEDAYAHQVVLPGSGVATQISVGLGATCAVVDDEAVCWGIGLNHRLPSGDTSGYDSPTQFSEWEALE